MVSTTAWRLCLAEAAPSVASIAFYVVLCSAKCLILFVTSLTFRSLLVQKHHTESVSFVIQHIGGFHKWGYPNIDGLYGKIHKWNDLGVPLWLFANIGSISWPTASQLRSAFHVLSESYRRILYSLGKRSFFKTQRLAVLQRSEFLAKIQDVPGKTGWQTNEELP